MTSQGEIYLKTTQSLCTTAEHQRAWIHPARTMGSYHHHIRPTALLYAETGAELCASASACTHRPCAHTQYMGTSLRRHSTPLGPYSRTLPRALWQS